MSAYTDGQDELAWAVLEVLNAPLSDEARLANIRTMVTELLPNGGEQ
jgi:hypothetical protein